MDGSKMKLYREDEVILREGESNRVMYKILSGKAARYFHYGEENEYLLGILSEQRCFGEIGMLTGRKSQFTVVALSDVLVMRIDKEEFSDFIVSYPKNALEIMTNMAGTIVNMGVNMRMVINELVETVAKLPPEEAEAALSSLDESGNDIDISEEQDVSSVLSEELQKRILKYKLSSIGGEL